MRMFGPRARSRSFRSTRRISAMPGRKTKRLPWSCASERRIDCTTATSRWPESGWSRYRVSTGKSPAVAGDHRRLAQEIRDWSTVQRGRHHEQAEILAKDPLRFETEGQACIGLQAPFVEFIEEDDRVSAERRVVLEQATEDAFRDHFNSGLGPHLRVESHAIADRSADRFTQRGGHAMGCGACGKPPRFQHKQSLSVEPGSIKQGQRHPRRFSGARRRGQQRIPSLRQRATKGRQHIFYWKSGHGRFGRHESVAGCRKTISAQQHFDGLHVWDNRITPRDRQSILSMKHETPHPSAETPAKGFSPGFAALGLEAALLTTLDTLGYEEPTPIQREAIPPLLAGRDLLGQAATGTGKTAAFTLPLLQRIAHSARRCPSVLILVPTRELAIQVAEAVTRYGKELKISVLPVYGGQAIGPQLHALRRGVDVIVATPGRALDHIRRKTLQLKTIQIVVLDEADEMLDMGFAEDLDAILEQTPKERQTALFSATMPLRIASIAKRHLKEPVEIRIAKEPIKAGAVPRVHQTAYIVARQHKELALARILDMEAPKSALVFCRTRIEVDELTAMLIGRGHKAEAIHGGMNQPQRDRVMSSFRSGQTELLVATDVAARGLDIPSVSHVVNYDLPTSPEGYVHRIGRTGRAGREGVAITVIDPREQRLLWNIEQLTKAKIVVTPVPTVADLRTKRLARTKSAIEEVLDVR